jgi:hypothetical protein
VEVRVKTALRSVIFPVPGGVPTLSEAAESATVAVTRVVTQLLAVIAFNKPRTWTLRLALSELGMLLEVRTFDPEPPRPLD